MTHRFKKKRGKALRKTVALMLANNTGGTLRQRLLDGAALRMDNLTHTAIPVWGAITPSMTRSTTATCVDSWGRQVTALAGELRFPGARRVYNLLASVANLKSEDLTSSGWGKVQVAATAGAITENSANSLHYVNSAAIGTGVKHTVSFRASLASGTRLLWSGDSAFVAEFNLQTGTAVVAAGSGSASMTLVSAGVYDCQYTVNTWATTGLYIGLASSSGVYSYVGNGTSSINVSRIQIENVTGQSVQTAGEYVSVGTVQRNMLLFSNKFDESVWGGGGATVAQNAASPTGLNCDAGWTVTDANGGATLYIARTALTLTATDYKLTLLVGKTSGATSFPTLAAYHTTPTALAAICTIDTNNGIATPWTAYTGFTIVPSSATCTSHDDTYWKVVLTFTADAASTWRLDIAPASTANATQSTGVLNAAVTGSAKFAAAMLTLASADQTYQPVGGSFQYHGSMVDGVKCFPTDLSGNPLPTRATFDAVSLAGVSGSYVSTPDSVAASITGDIDIRVKVAATDWTPSANATIITKDLDSGAAGSRAYGLYLLNTSGALVYQWSTDGSTLVSETSSATDGGAALTCGGVDGSALWVRVTHAVSGTVTFYTSSDGITWSQLGVPQSTSAGAIYDNARSLRLGATGASGTVVPLSGKIYRAQIYSGINGTLAVDFDASRYSGGGTTLTGSTGETWTLNGTATIHPTNIPMTTPLIEAAATNICLQSNAFTTTWTSAGTGTTTQDAIGPDGSTSAWTLADTDAAAYRVVTSGSIAVSASTAYTASIFVKKVGSLTVAPLLEMKYTGGVTTYFQQVINPVAGTVVSFTGSSAPTQVIVESYNTNYWRVKLTATSPVGTTALLVSLYPAINADASATGSTAATGSNVFFGCMVEAGSAATSYIPTTTGAVARNADQLYYTGALLGQIKTLAVRGFKRDVGVSNVGVIAELNDGTANEDTYGFFSSATNIGYIGRDGGSTVLQSASVSAATNTYTPGTSRNFAISTGALAADKRLSEQGATITPSIANANVGTVTRLGIGMYNDGTFQLNGYPGKIYGFTRNLSQAELNGVTT